MDLQINKDPQKLNDSIFSGRKWWQYLCIILSFAVAIVFTLVFKDKIDSNLSSIICAVIIVPLGYVGVFSKNGLDFFEYYKQKKANSTGSNIFLYVNEPSSKRKNNANYIVGKENENKKTAKMSKKTAKLSKKYKKKVRK